ncbi:ATP synthase F1 subcomplex epsilon subunit [Microcella putealis]|uniref:ATP synthase F1 subcomplex epsilon subunit n=1 Tax=Microcella putealis TaxID=337005 RepID=A0A4Q7LWG5_9MICO|nr:F0F1 ATP synthase subunit epsilon [Microcella putealis]RZS59164.1 ATP synthase F1 subcomplex epsilon subunit [Microcella putealis]TQM24190.1 ATP synthase F1 subcomplex epsilon subunit [Microcella putealis]
MAELSVSVVAADREVWSGAAKQISARTTEGDIGILPGHEPVLGILGQGEVRITPVSGSPIVARAEDGFLSVENNTVTIVAGLAEIL